MNRAFADTFFFLAYLNSRDDAHSTAVRHFESFDGELITTQAVLTEVADGMASPEARRIFVDFYAALRLEEGVTIVAMDAELFAAGMNLYGSRLDKRWSLTDCISFITMQREGLLEALTGDHHFEQAGFIACLRS